ncbi:MAG: cytochrome c [Gammaproteobacteria bacterium]|nr:MAG: cytochrome c [Gammaproteobacteria bacterium]
MRIRCISKFATMVTIALASFALLVSGAAVADGDDHDHGETSDAAKYRHTVMEAMGSHFAAVALILTKRVDMPDDLLIHATALANTAATVDGLFAAGSEGGDALPLIWEEPDEVDAAAQEVMDATAALASALEGGDRSQIKTAFKATGTSCKGCHERYKEEDED